MRKIWCNGYHYNFASETMLEEHRTGPYEASTGAKCLTAIGRHCLTQAEIQAKGWPLQTMAIEAYHDGNRCIDHLPTQITPERLAKMQVLLERMQQRHFNQ